MAPIPPDAPEEIRKILNELFDPEDIGGVRVSEDGTRVQATIYIDGSVSTQTYIRNERTGHYELMGYRGQAMAKTDIG
jgi:hypothetical protein